jgi:uncharacterized membrane protein YgcG
MKKTAILLVLLLVCSVAWAADYSIVSYDIDVDVSAANVYGIRESILVDFSEPRHGIFREIPVQFGKRRVKLTDIESSVPVERDSVSSAWVTLRLGSEDRTVTGLQQYELSYVYGIGDDGYPDYDEFYFNLLGTGWQAPVESFSYTVRFPFPIDDPSMVWVTGGLSGSTEQIGSYSLSADRRTISGTAGNLAPGEALTLRVQMEQGYFAEAKPYRDYTVPASVAAVVLGLFLCFLATVVFRKYGKEELFVPVVRFEPPEGLSPLEVGYLADGRVDNKDLTSLIFYWADQGCLNIMEEGKDEMVFEKIRRPDTDKRQERLLFDAMFACGDGKTVSLDQMETNKFAAAMEKSKSSVRSYFKGERRLKDQAAEKKRIVIVLFAALAVVADALASTVMYVAEETLVLLAIGGMVAIVGGSMSWNIVRRWEISTGFAKISRFGVLGLFALAAGIAMALVQHFLIGQPVPYAIWMSVFSICVPLYLAFLSVVTGKRSAYATRMLEQTVGYREFIDKVEMDKLKLMIADDPQLFYHVLGFAIVLGLEDVWAKKFRNLTIDQPSWYRGTAPVYDALFYSALAHRLHSNVMEHTVFAQAKGGARGAVGSSFGSGGFSGGGFGGGGGGSW